MEAIICSMTPQERRTADSSTPSARIRIAKGSGVSRADVNRVLKAREAMQKLAKQLGAVNRKASRPGLPRRSERRRGW